jgi:TonB family protein
VRIGGDQPRYPPAFRRAVREGRVVAEVTLNLEGEPERPQILLMERGGPVMAIAVLEALRTWKFEPAQFEGRPAAVRYSLTVTYRIEG